LEYFIREFIEVSRLLPPNEVLDYFFAPATFTVYNLDEGMATKKLIVLLELLAAPKMK
jgi:hypothetical protein